MAPDEFDSDLHPTPPYDTWPEPSQTTPDTPPSVGGSNWIGLLFGGFMFIALGIIVGSAEPDADPFPAVMILMGVVVMLLAPLARRSEIEANIQRDLRLEEQQAEDERLREEEKQEIVRAVKSTIKIRCRYCGTLNEEKATRCESCGGSL
jgi:ribosomal protein L40E